MPETLVILTPGFPADEADTTCIPPQQVFVKALKECYPNLNIIILSLHYPFRAKEYVWNGIKVIAFGGRSKGGFNRLYIWWNVWHRLRKINRHYEPLGILSFWLGDAAFIGKLFAKQKKLKHYTWLLGQDAKAGNKYVRWIMPKGGELIAISDFIVNQYHHNYGLRPEHVIPVGVYPAAIKQTDVARAIDILGAGSLISLKRYHLLVELIHELKKDFPDIRAVICGDGPEMGNLKALTTQLGMEGNLALAGELPHQQVLDMMQHAKLFVHPSKYEGFSTVCLEALYAGAGVVSFIKPMDADLPNWNIANTTNEMLAIAKAILHAPSVERKALLPYAVGDSAKAIMELFNYRE
nr:glycosyltransferase [uncultured Mucilaginibacter sp.]